MSLSIPEDPNLHVSWAEEAPEFLNSSNASPEDLMAENPEMKRESETGVNNFVQEEAELVGAIAPTPKRVIPFDYDQFCSDMPDNLLPIFKGCSRIKEIRSNSASGDYLTVPGVHYGKNKSEAARKGKVSKSESDLPEEKVGDLSERIMDTNDNDLEEFQIKEPMTLHRKKSLNNEEVEQTDSSSLSSCSIM